MSIQILESFLYFLALFYYIEYHSKNWLFFQKFFWCKRSEQRVDQSLPKFIFLYHCIHIFISMFFLKCSYSFVWSFLSFAAAISVNAKYMYCIFGAFFGKSFLLADGCDCVLSSTPSAWHSQAMARCKKWQMFLWYITLLFSYFDFFCWLLSQWHSGYLSCISIYCMLLKPWIHCLS